MITNFTTQYLPPLLLVVIIALAALLLLYWLSRRGIATRLWGAMVRYKGALTFLFAVILFVVAFGTFLVRRQSSEAIKEYEMHTFDSASNLVSTGLLPVNPITGTTLPAQVQAGPDDLAHSRAAASFDSGAKLSTNVIVVQPGMRYRYSVTMSGGNVKPRTPGTVQTRFVWFDSSLAPITWTDSVAVTVEPPTIIDPGVATPQLSDFIRIPEMFLTGTDIAPAGATRLQFEIRNTGNTGVNSKDLKLSAQGVYIEPHPHATSGSLAFSFDWETAMGGAVHSKGDEIHDVAGAVRHGLEMREGADWLNDLFVTNHISATFYGTGYNLLDGNTERRTFNGNPTYEWAAPKNGWHSEYWLAHPWFSDDPFGTYESDPAWYFGDQTRALMSAGHEIAPHTFAHIYVRGSNPQELATDLDEWIDHAKLAGVPPPATFAFPWRSSNSLTSDFYDVLSSRGIRAVTRIYAPDMKDLYTLGNAVVYTDIKYAQPYPDMPVMPDFLLGSPSASAGEEAGGAPITREQGLEVIEETVARRGTTSFWQHPEQLARDPSFDVVRAAWTDVVGEAARERDHGRLWIATVTEITAYQRDVMSVTASIQPGTPGGKWRIEVRNASGKELRGVTLTLPGEASAVTGQTGTVQSVSHPDPDQTRLGAPGQLAGPTRQLVLATLAPGTTAIEVEWVDGQEPLQ
jgi:peptidoglycan/xylan/chitin deacetylase (PgdA/CDA1 family)